MNSNDKTSAPDRREELIAQVRQHANAARTARLYAERAKHAVACGKALWELKKVINWGEWAKWLQERCDLNRMTANRYMRLAKREEVLTPFLSIRQAYIAAEVIQGQRVQQKAASPRNAGRSRSGRL